MTLELPRPIAAYFTADAIDGDNVAQCFTESAVVKDEGHAYHGRTEIRQWKTDTSSKYEYVCEPLTCEQNDDKVIANCRLTGTFPGSPVNLRFCFGLEGEKIASLEIAS